MLSPIGLGTWQFSKGRGLVGGYWPSLSDEAIRNIVSTALAGGINWFDTAEVYGNGQSEVALARALDALDADKIEAFIATKWWPLLRAAGSVQVSFQRSLDRLHGRPVMLYQIHQPYARSSIASQMRAMAGLLDQGVIQHAGVSNFSLAQMREAHRALKSHGHHLASNQVRYHLLDRRIERNGLLSAAQDLGITIIAYSPLAQGLLTGKFHESTERPRGMRRWSPAFRPDALRRTRPLIDLCRELADRYHVAIAQVALNWLITVPGECVMAIPGATTLDQARFNAGAMGWTLSASDRAALDEVSASAGGPS